MPTDPPTAPVAVVLTEDALTELGSRIPTQPEYEALLSAARDRAALVKFLREHGEEIDRWVAPDIDDEAGSKACGALRHTLERFCK